MQLSLLKKKEKFRMGDRRYMVSKGDSYQWKCPSCDEEMMLVASTCGNTMTVECKCGHSELIERPTA